MKQRAELIKEKVRERIEDKAAERAEKNKARFSKKMKRARLKGDAEWEDALKDTIPPLTIGQVIAAWNESDVAQAAGIAKWKDFEEGRIADRAAEAVWKEAKAREALRAWGFALANLKMAERGEVGFPENGDWNWSETECGKVLEKEIRDATLAALGAMKTKYDEMKAAIEEVGADSRMAARAALRTEAKTKSKAEVNALAADLVATFKEFDTALQDETGTQVEIAAGVIADAKEKGRLIGGGGVPHFLKLWRGWGSKRGRPDAMQYAEIHEREGRWPV